MTDPRIRPEAMLHVGDFFAINGDDGSARQAYREVLHSNRAEMAAAAAQRLDALDMRTQSLPQAP